MHWQLGCLSQTISCTPTFARLDLAGVQDPLADERDGVSFAPVLRGEKNALEDPERHRVAILVEKPVSRCLQANPKFLSEP